MPALNPSININGSSAKNLIEYIFNARTAVADAMAKLAETRPHARDYQLNYDQYKIDLEIYMQRFSVLDKLYNDLEDDIVNIQNQMTFES